jgi:hypothetical protein
VLSLNVYFIKISYTNCVGQLNALANLSLQKELQNQWIRCCMGPGIRMNLVGTRNISDGN